MAKYEPWKALERRHAKRMRGVRLWRPDYSDSIPDGENEEEAWDAKAYAHFSVITLFVEAERKYREYTAGRRFHLCLFARDRKAAGDFVLLRATDYAALVANQRRGRILHTDDYEELTNE